MGITSLQLKNHRALTSQRDAIARICRWLFPLISLSMIVLASVYWFNGQLLLPLLLECIVMLFASILLWIIDHNDSNAAGKVICISVGIVSVCSFVQFGPVLGIGLTWFAWMLVMQLFLSSVIWPVLLAGVVIVSVAIFEQLGLTPLWMLDPTGYDWVRMSMVTVVVMGGGAWSYYQMRLSLFQALDNEWRAQEERLRIERELNKAQRLESLGRLASGVAHDFNNSLAILITGVDAVRNAMNDEDRARFLSNMEHAIEGAVATSRKLLSISKQGVDPALPTNPQKSISPLIELLKRLLPENITIKTSLENTDYIAMPSGELDQILLNLCLNSRDAMSKGGELLISCRNMDDRVVLEISDSGDGMDFETKNKALEPHFTTKKDGSGLGLSIIDQAVYKYQGTITLNSKLNTGTTVTITFPAIEPQSPNSAKQVQPRNNKLWQNGKCKILLLEDEDMLREFFNTVLTNKGYVVHCVATVAQALDALQQQSFDIMISDAGLPDGDPSSAIRMFRKTGTEPVIVCSGHVESEELIKGLSLNEYAFLQKPFSVNKLLEVLEGF